MSPRGSKQNEKMRAEAMEKITIAALKVFAEYGYHGTTIKKIAGVSGLSYGLVYHYFPSKEKVFRFIIDTSIDSSQQATEMILSGPGSAWDRISALSGFLVREALTGESSRYFLVVLHALTQSADIEGFKEHVSKRIEHYYELLSPLIRDSQLSGEAADGDPVVLAAAYFSFVQGLALLAVQDSDLINSIGPDMLLRVLAKRG